MARRTVLFFDVNETLIDFESLKESIARLLGSGPESARLWFSMLLHHSLVATVTDHFEAFDDIAATCLRMLGRLHGVELSESAAREAIAPIRSLPPHSDVLGTLKKLQAADYRMFTLTISSSKIHAEQMKHARLGSYFEALISAEEVGLYKPHTHVYRWAARRVGAAISDCLLVNAHGWDLAGAAWAGMQTAFIARPGSQIYPLGPDPDLTLPSLADLPQALEQLERRERS